MIIYEPKGVKQFSVTTTPQKLTPPEGACRALITVETENIRYRDDYTSPTTSVGLLLVKDALPFPYEGDVDNFIAVAVVNTATVTIAYYGKRSENA